MYPISLPATNQVEGILSHKKDFLKIPKKKYYFIKLSKKKPRASGPGFEEFRKLFPKSPRACHNRTMTK
jgi:hypothetical protein